VKRLFLVAGESSGDMHGAGLVRALRTLDEQVVCEGLGGSQMAAAGMNLHGDLAGKAVMGFSEVARALGMLRRVFLDTVQRLERTRPDALVLIDYPGFNIRLGRRAHALGIPVVYYISPQVWAWKRKRIHTIAEFVQKMLVILPFEQELYTSAGVDCTYVGHPLLDRIAAREKPREDSAQPLVGLFPGSRAQEIERLMATMLEVARGIAERHPEARFVTPCVDVERERQVRHIAGDFPLQTGIGNAYEVLSAARLCVVASGTATLETALFGVPMLIMYRVGRLNYWLARRLVRVQHIGLVNIVAGRRIVPEFIQRDATAEKMLPEALALFEDNPERQQMIRNLEAVRAALGEAGASQRAAREILAVVEGSHHA